MSSVHRTGFSDAFWYVTGGLLLAASTIIRVISIPVMTSDYIHFISKWFSALASSPGLSAFGEPFANYAPLYLYLLKGLTYIPASSRISAKSLSLIFDIAIAAAACAILLRLQPARSRAARLFFAFALMLSIPTVVLNSSLWGQSDAVYGAFIMGSVLSIFLSVPMLAAILFAFAFSFKVQSLFFLPVLAGYLAARRKSIHLLWIPAIFILMTIPAGLGGGNWWYWLFIYGRQAGEYSMLTMNAPSLFAFMSNVPDAIAGALTYAGIMVAGIVAVSISVAAARATLLRTADAMLRIMLLGVIAIPFLLPRMHERYFYLADLFAVLYALYNPRRWYVPVLVVGASFLSYLPYLADSVPPLSAFIVDLRIPAAAMAVALAAVLMDIVRAWQKTPDAAPGLRSGV